MIFPIATRENRCWNRLEFRLRPNAPPRSRQIRATMLRFNQSRGSRVGSERWKLSDGEDFVHGNTHPHHFDLANECTRTLVFGHRLRRDPGRVCSQ